MSVNIPLFVLDYIVLLPVTLLRLFLIYCSGARYNIPSFPIFDVIMHADKPKFNGGEMKVSTVEDDAVRIMKSMLQEEQKDSSDKPKKSRKKKQRPRGILEILDDNIVVSEKPKKSKGNGSKNDTEYEIRTDSIFTKKSGKRSRKNSKIDSEAKEDIKDFEVKVEVNRNSPIEDSCGNNNRDEDKKLDVDSHNDHDSPDSQDSTDRHVDSIDLDGLDSAGSNEFLFTDRSRPLVL